MRVAYIMNTIDRYDITKAITEENIGGCGIPRQQVKVIISDNGSKEESIRNWAAYYSDVFLDNFHNIGNPQALNNGLSVGRALECDYFVIAGNDIKLKSGWLRDGIQAMQSDKDLGLLGFDWRGSKDGEIINGIRYAKSIFGTWLITKRCLQICGFFSTFSKYGLWDGEWHTRVTTNGFKKGYLNSSPSTHCGNDVHEQSPYRLMKNEELKKAIPNNDRVKRKVKRVDRLNREL